MAPAGKYKVDLPALIARLERSAQNADARVTVGPLPDMAGQIRMVFGPGPNDCRFQQAMCERFLISEGATVEHRRYSSSRALFCIRFRLDREQPASRGRTSSARSASAGLTLVRGACPTPGQT